MPWDLQSSGPTPLPRQGHTTPNSHPSDPHDFCQMGPQGLPSQWSTYPRSPLHWTAPPRHAQACTISTLQAWAPKVCQAGDTHTHNPCSAGGTRRPAQACTGLHHLCFSESGSQGLPHQRSTDIYDLRQAMPSGLQISALLGHAPKAWQAEDPQTFTISAWPRLLACTGLHNHRWAAPFTPTQACKISAGSMPLKPAKPAIYRQAVYPLAWPTPFRQARPTLQRPTNSPQLRASTHLPPTTEDLQTCLRDTHRQVWMLKEYHQKN
jgi:hypothetical protein